MTLTSAAALLMIVTGTDRPSDRELLAKARYAIEKANDCAAAVTALKAVSSAMRSDPRWIYYMAEASACSGDAAEALRLYRLYDEKVPGQAGVQDKIGELSYRADAEAKDRADRAEEARQTRLRRASIVGAWRWGDMELEFRSDCTSCDVHGVFRKHPRRPDYVGRSYFVGTYSNGKFVGRRSSIYRVTDSEVWAITASWGKCRHLISTWDEESRQFLLPYSDRVEFTISDDGTRLEGYVADFDFDSSRCLVVTKEGGDAVLRRIVR